MGKEIRGIRKIRQVKGFLEKAKEYKKHGAIAVLFVFVEMVYLSAYRGRFYGREWHLSSFVYELYHFEILPKPVRIVGSE